VNSSHLSPTSFSSLSTRKQEQKEEKEEEEDYEMRFDDMEDEEGTFILPEFILPIQVIYYFKYQTKYPN